MNLEEILWDAHFEEKQEDEDTAYNEAEELAMEDYRQKSVRGFEISLGEL